MSLGFPAHPRAGERGALLRVLCGESFPHLRYSALEVQLNMARKKEEKAETAPETVVVAAAKAIGKAAGKIAALAGATGPALKAPAAKRGRLAPKNKSRLPRKQKKAQKKAAKAS
jgi:hypothetical protein